MSVQEEIAALIGMLVNQSEAAGVIDGKTYGWKTANRNLRKTALVIEKRLKALRRATLDLEK